MVNSATSQATRPRAWRVRHPYLTDKFGRPDYYRGHEPTFHGMIFFFGSAGTVRAVLAMLHPAFAWAYIGAYAGCVLAGLGIGWFVRTKLDDRFSRKLSASLGMAGFVPANLMTMTVTHPVAMPAIAGTAPLVASAVMVAGAVLTHKLADWFPDPDVQPRRRKP